MDLGMIGLGRMGANIVRRLMRDGHRCVAHDVSEAAIAGFQGEGAVGARSLADLAGAAPVPRHVWVMVPAGITGKVIDDLATHLDAGDTIIDGGNSNYYRRDPRDRRRLPSGASTCSTPAPRAACSATGATA